MHTEAHPLVFNRSIKAAHPAQRTAASLSPHRQVGLWPHTALLPPPRRAAPHRCAAPHHLAPEPGPHHPDPLARTPKRWPARRGGLRVIPPHETTDLPLANSARQPHLRPAPSPPRQRRRRQPWPTRFPSPPRSPRAAKPPGKALGQTNSVRGLFPFGRSVPPPRGEQGR
jgi:hypothetical protein